MLIICILLATITILTRQQANLTYQILSQGESIEIPLQQYFENASTAVIIPQKSTLNKTNFDINLQDSNNDTFRQVSKHKMQFIYQNKTITLQNYKSTRTIENQPIKLFLLDKNFIMLYIYKQSGQTQAEKQANGVSLIGLNLQQHLDDKYKNKGLNCTGMQPQIIDSQLLYVVCKINQKDSSKTFIVLQVIFLSNQQGFINNMKISQNIAILQHKSITCNEYSLKYFQKINIQNCHYSDIFAYCKSNQPGQLPVIYCFRNISSGIKKTNRVISDFQQCITNAAYITLTQNGFLSVINKKIFQYKDISGQTSCKKTITNNIIDPAYATSRFYNSIQISYFFITKDQNSIFIKSSYRTNYQTFMLQQRGYKITSYALTQLYMMLIISKFTGENVILIYQMTDLYPRLISRQLIENSTYENIQLMSTGNYLQNGFYVFFYNKTNNQLSLKQYLGNKIKITPKSNMFQSKQPPKISLYQNALVQGKLNSNIYEVQQQQNIKNFTLYILENTTKKKYLIVNVIVRKFDDTGLSLNFSNTRMVTIDSSYVYLNLTSLALGPFRRFYLDSRLKDKNIRLSFVNYQNKINIRQVAQQYQAIITDRGLQRVVINQTIKQIALNLQLKVLNPVFTLYYNSYIKNCYLKYTKNQDQFEIDCKNQDKISFKSKIQQDTTKIIIITKDKWLQYSKQLIQLCSITGQSGQCQLLPIEKIPVYGQIHRIKLNTFKTTLSGYTQIQLFILCEYSLYFGVFYRENSTMKYTYNRKFFITPNQVTELGPNRWKLNNINFDKYYTCYLLLHLTKTDLNGSIMHAALIYDRPSKSSSGKFLGHLIRKFDSQRTQQKIQSIMTNDRLLIILYRMPDGIAKIQQYQITEFYTIFETRRYPLYGRSIVRNGSHTSDGQFLYIESELQRKQQGKTQYLVFCPSLSTPNLLTHVVQKQSSISFIQIIGNIRSRYPHSIGINGHNIFAISIPNLVIRFDYDQNKNNKTVIPGQLPIKIIDYKNTLYQLNYKYQFNVGAQGIQIMSNINNQIKTQNKKISFILPVRNITGPVMSIDLDHNLTYCNILQKNIQFTDVFTKTQCLYWYQQIRKYGILLDLISTIDINRNQVQIIITTQKLLCVSNKINITVIDLNYSKSCTIVNFINNMGIFICDQDQNTMIYAINLKNTCEDLSFSTVTKPTWLPYQEYFKMKFNDPYVVFQVPIRVQTNKIYFLTKFINSNFTQFSTQYGLTYQQIDNFNTKDFQIDSQYAYMLEDGLGIYNMTQIMNTTKETIQPDVWIQDIYIQKALNTTADLVYIKPTKLHSSQPSLSNQTTTLSLQIGTTTHAYDILIKFQKIKDKMQTKAQIIIKLMYKQYKDCKNNEISQSKHYQGIKIKLCLLQLQQNLIFSNYMPITAKSEEYYMQFYYNPNNDSNYMGTKTVYPFRMQKISTNDTFEINQLKGQLIVRSLFNFICYYKLSTQIKWVFTLKNQSNYKSNQYNNESCNMTLLLKNQYSSVSQTLTIKGNNSNKQQKSYRPLIFRIFYGVLCFFSVIKFLIYLERKKIKMNKMKYNLLSNQFQHMVKLNSKKNVSIFSNNQSQGSKISKY